MKKEFARFFKDKRMVMTAILPGILIYVIYSFMGGALETMFTDDVEAYRVAAVNLPASVESICKAAGEGENGIAFEFVEGGKEDVEAGNVDIYAVFPEDFDQKVAEYTDITQSAPSVEIYYDSAETVSYNAYLTLEGILDGYESAIANKFNVNMGGAQYDLATEEDMTAMMFSMLLPMLLMMFLYSGCMALAPESIAGEKERGTIATLLVTPIKRSELAIGKIASLSALSLFSGLFSFMGTVLALPKLMGAAGELDASVYSVGDYAMLLLVIFSTILVLVSLVSILSALANSVKESSTLLMPLMIITMLLGLSSMFGGGVPDDLYWYCIPLYNSVQCMNGVFSFAYSPVQIVVTVLVNIAVSGFFVFVLTKLFNSEKVMFSK